MGPLRQTPPLEKKTAPVTGGRRTAGFGGLVQFAEASREVFAASPTVS